MPKLSEDLKNNALNQKQRKQYLYSYIASNLANIFSNSIELHDLFCHGVEKLSFYDNTLYDRETIPVFDSILYDRETESLEEPLNPFFIRKGYFDMKYHEYHEIKSKFSDRGLIVEKRVKFKYSAVEIAKICLICLQENQFHETVSKIINILNKMEEGHFFEIKNEEIFYKSLNNVEILEDKRINQDLKVMELKNRFYKLEASYQEKINVILNMQRGYLKDETLSKLLGISYVKDLILAFNNFCNKPEVEGSNHSGEGKKATKKATEEELQIMFDFGLTLIRLAKANNLI